MFVDGNIVQPMPASRAPVTARLQSSRGRGAWRSSIIQHESKIDADMFPNITTSNLGYSIEVKNLNSCASE